MTLPISLICCSYNRQKLVSTYFEQPLIKERRSTEKILSFAVDTVTQAHQVVYTAFLELRKVFDIVRKIKCIGTALSWFTNY